MILPLADARLFDLGLLGSGERVDHVDFLLLDAANPLTVLDDGVVL